MRWIEVSVDTPAELIDERCQQMADMGADGFVIENEADFQNFLENNHQYWDYVDDELEQKFAGVSRIKCYLSDDADGKAILAKIRGAYGAVQTAFIEDSDWENNWREYYKPIEVGEKLVVVPEWEEIPADGRQPLRLDPGLIFGTGSHATTRMCLAALEKYCSPETTVLDLGCGSGILAIASLLLGAESATGVDIDELAVKTAEENGKMNGFDGDRLKFIHGDLADKVSGKFDIVVANIVADIIIMFCKTVPEFMADNAVFITSGIIDIREQEVVDAFAENGFEIIARHANGGWRCFECRRKN